MLTLALALTLTAAATPQRAVRIIYTGDRRGVGAGFTPFASLGPVQAAAGAPDLQMVHGVLVQEPWVLLPEHLDPQGAVDFLAGGDVRCTRPSPSGAVEIRTELVITPPGDFADALVESGGTPSEYGIRDCTNGAGAKARLVGPAGRRPGGFPTWELSDFEFRQALAGALPEGGPELLVIGRPVQGGPRTVARIDELRADDPGALYVDAGSFLDGASSVADGALSLHRPLGVPLLQRLGPDALAPGETELLAGARHFLDEIASAELPYIASNWSAEDPALALPPSHVVEAQTPGGPVRVGFVAALDPALARQIPRLGEEGITIGDPVTGTQAAIDALTSSDRPPDAVVVLTTASADVMADLRRYLHGADVMLGDPTFATLRVAERRTTLRTYDRDIKGAPVTLPLDGLGTVDLSLSVGRLKELSSTPELVRGDLPLDPELSAALTATRAAHYPELDHPLLPELPAEEWPAVVCRAVLDATGADTVLLRTPPRPSRLPGPRSELQIADQLAVLDVLEVHRVPGDKMKQLLDQSYGVVPVSCGALPGVKFPKARGRSIESDRTYRVVTTDRTRWGTPLQSILPTVHATKPLDGAASRVLTHPDGTPVTLRGVVLGELRARRDAEGSPEAALESLRAPLTKPTLWLLRVRQISLSSLNFVGTESDAFAAVPETLVTSPSSLSLATDNDVALEVSSAAIAGDLRFQGAFSTLETDDAEEELSDDWKLSTSLSLPALAFPQQTALRAMPFSELMYDSEFTPTEQEDGTVNDTQADLSLTLGLATLRWGALRSLRVGALASRDLNQERAPELGGRLTWETSVSLVGPLKWGTLGDVQLYALTPEDDESDLRLRGLGETRLSLPLARWLSLSAVGQVFAFQGRKPATDELGATWSAGLALGGGGAFEL